MTFSNVREKIRSNYDDLTKNHKVIAHWILENSERVPFQSVQDLSKDVGISDASIIRFAQRIGYKGYTELKEALADGVVDRLANISIPKLDELGHEEINILTSVANHDISNIRQTLQEIDSQSFDSAVTSILNANRIHIVVLGISYLMARILAYQLRQTGQFARAFRHGENSFSEESLFVSKEDLVIPISFPPYSKETITLSKRMASMAVPILAITDQQSAPGALHANQVLVVHSENMLYTNSFSAISVLINAISTECARREPERARSFVNNINKLANENDEFVK